MVKVTPPVLTVTVDVPPASAISSGLAVTLSVSSSSSVIVRVTSAGAFAGPLSGTLPDTVTVLSAASRVLSRAVMVTVPVLSVALAAKLRVLFVLSVKSLDVAGCTAAAATVTANGVLEALVTDAVTVLTPPLSPIDSGVSFSVTRGEVSIRHTGTRSPTT